MKWFYIFHASYYSLSSFELTEVVLHLSVGLVRVDIPYPDLRAEVVLHLLVGLVRVTIPYPV